MSPDLADAVERFVRAAPPVNEVTRRRLLDIAQRAAREKKAPLAAAA